MGMPFCWETVCARSAARDSRTSANRCMSCDRSSRLRSRHSGARSAARAAATAASMSAGPASGKDPSFSSVAAENTSIRSLPRELAHVPSMNKVECSCMAGLLSVPRHDVVTLGSQCSER